MKPDDGVKIPALVMRGLPFEYIAGDTPALVQSAGYSIVQGLPGARWLAPKCSCPALDVIEKANRNYC
ncbi:MAG: hypothetical protein PHG14_15725 [Desulfobacter postgatei]|uniref:hypothetical protein n=1 Tax=Desulfobacter postgatei TaxID=2293 RepID=UPI0023F116EF|nr:hypothetical protein [Desulfobacter postgatei]MDD4275165.1 hypothetical protein [Desulfobacter postgatei]